MLSSQRFQTIELLIAPLFMVLCGIELFFPFWNSTQKIPYMFMVGSILTGATHYSSSVGTYINHTETKKILSSSWPRYLGLGVLGGIAMISLIYAKKNNDHLFGSLLLNQIALAFVLWIRISHTILQSYGLSSLRFKYLKDGIVVSQALAFEKLAAISISIGLCLQLYSYQPAVLVLIPSLIATRIAIACFSLAFILMFRSILYSMSQPDTLRNRFMHKFKYVLACGAAYSSLAMWGIKWLHYVEYVNLNDQFNQNTKARKAFWKPFLISSVILGLIFTFDVNKFSFSSLIPFYELINITWTIALFIHIGMDKAVFNFAIKGRQQVVLKLLQRGSSEPGLDKSAA